MIDPQSADLPLWLDALLSALLLIGAFFTLVASWGLAKLSEFVRRLHGPTKAATLGVGCTLIVSSAYFSYLRGTPNLHELLITLFVFLTAPVSAHMMIRAAMALDPGIRTARPDPAKSRPDASRETR